MIKKYDAIILGCGVAGAYTALHLFKNGFSNICIIEKKEFPRIKPCTGMLTEPAYNMLLEIDIDVITDFDYGGSELLRKTDIYYKYSKQISMTNTSQMYCSDKATRKDFDTHLYNLIKEKGITILENTKIENIEYNNNHITTNNGDYKYKYLVFADGINGYSSKFTNIKRKSICFEAVFPKSIKDKNAFYDLYFGISNKGYAWIAQTYSNISIGLSDEYNKETDYQKLLIEFAKKNGYTIDKKIIRGAFVPMEVSDIITKGENVMVIGDAAGFTNPLTMEGISQSFESAKLASISIQNNDISHYIEKTKDLKNNQIHSLKIAKKLFNPILQKIIWKVASKLCKKFVAYGYSKIIVEKQYSMCETKKAFFHYYFNKKKMR